jgi:hypothetical protein
MKVAGTTILLLIGAFAFIIHTTVAGYNSNYRIAKQAYVQVRSKVLEHKTGTTENLNLQIQGRGGNISSFTLFNYFENNGSAVFNLQANDTTAWVWRKLPGATRPVGFKFLKRNNEWFIDTVENLDILVLKIEHAK